MKSRPDAPVCWAAASAEGKTTVAGWKTDSLWTSSCSTTCEDAPFTSAAKRGEDRRRETNISLGPPSGPIVCANRSNASTGRAFRPAKADETQSRKSSSVRATTSLGRSSNRRSARDEASWRVTPVVVVVIICSPPGWVDGLRGVSLLVDHDRTLERDHDRAVPLVPGRLHGYDPDVRARPGRALFQDL